MLYGLVASILAVMLVVGLLTYRMGESPWRWPLLAVIVAGLVTIAGIFWIRRYVDKQTKASEQGSQQ
jgi:ABC-type nickel/cobalt efflux system permease component RcnA